MSKFEKIERIQRHQTKLAEELLKEANRVFPVGGYVTFTKGKGRITAEILDHSDYANRFDPSFWIRNVETHKEYRIDLYWLMKG